MSHPRVRPLTARQREALALVASMQWPTVRELAAALGVTPTGAYDHVQVLRHRGMLVRTPPGTSRTIALSAAGRFELFAPSKLRIGGERFARVPWAVRPRDEA